MNHAFVQRHKTRLVYPALVAAQGLQHIGYGVTWFDEEDAGSLDLTKDTLVVGFIEVVREAVQRVTGTKPPVINYPSELKGFTGRWIATDPIGTVRNMPTLWPIFIKPADDIKSFSGRVVRGVLDLVATAHLPDDATIFRSQVVEFLSEYRCFVINRSIIGVRHYKGDPLIFPNVDRIQQMVQAWPSAPRAYCLDVGVVRQGGASDGALQTVLVEVNDAYSAGDYGLDPLFYARFVEARWCEMTGALPLP